MEGLRAHEKVSLDVFSQKRLFLTLLTHQQRELASVPDTSIMEYKCRIGVG
ncbi:conserved hypothetical protein [Ricinus communis]|uniref:Uncharacterized protein n=1 Tax=Ricinus communis TaxID=3988 RepID=B9T3V2_RICCO|nr:conserved hypothetical protein [Ricinus communis]